MFAVGIDLEVGVTLMFGMQSFLATSLGLLALYTFGDCSDVLKGSPTLLSFG